MFLSKLKYGHLTGIVSSGFLGVPFGGYWWLAHFSRFCHLQIIDIQQYYKTMYRDTNP